MKKKIISVLLSFALIAGVLSGCGSADTTTKSESESSTATVSKSENNDMSDSENKDNKLTMFLDDAATQANFQDYLTAAEEATGLDIEVIAMPTNTADRTAKFMTILSSGDETIDIISADQEMLLPVVNAGYLEPLDDVLTDEVKAAYPESFIQMTDGKGVPMFMEIFCFWLNSKYVEEAGMDSVQTKEEFVQFLETVSKDNVYGYGGGWEQTYVWNDIGEFINLFGGDLYDWSNPQTQEAVKFLKEMVDNGWTAKSQIADQYTELNQRIMDGSVASMLNYSSFMPTYDTAGRYGKDDIYIAPMLNLGEEKTYANGWQYVLNAASTRKENAKIFLSWAASREGQKVYAETFSRIPARTDVIEDPSFSVPGIDEIKPYLEGTTLVVRPLPSNSSEYINEMGAEFQKYVSDEISFETYIEKMQECMNTYFPDEVK